MPTTTAWLRSTCVPVGRDKAGYPASRWMLYALALPDTVCQSQRRQCKCGRRREVTDGCLVWTVDAAIEQVNGRGFLSCKVGGRWRRICGYVAGLPGGIARTFGGTIPLDRIVAQRADALQGQSARIWTEPYPTAGAPAVMEHASEGQDTECEERWQHAWRCREGDAGERPAAFICNQTGSYRCCAWLADYG